MTGRPDRVGEAVARVVRLLPAVGEPGHASEFQLATGLALIFRARLDPLERLTVAAAAVLALDDEDAEALAEATLADLEADTIDEAERMRRQWAAWCGRDSRQPVVPGYPAQPPKSPRALLAEAWGQASDRDRRDLIARATRGVAA